MNRYLLFAGSSFYASGGFLDFIDSFDSLAAAREFALKTYPPDPDGEANMEWWHIIDAVTWQCVAVQNGSYNSVGMEREAIKPNRP